MSQVMRPTAVRAVWLGLALAGPAICVTTVAQAGDLAPPVYGPAPYPAPNYGAGYERGGPCRIVLDRRVDPYGREIVRRVRVCAEGGMYPPEAPVVAPGYGYPAPRYYEPRPSGYYAYPPRPPASVGPGYYN
jgi:hypothetical protein